MDKKNIENPLTLEQLREMDGRCAKVVVDGVEPLEMLVLIEIVEAAGAIILRNNLGGFDEYYSDDELKEDGIKVYAYPPAHIDREEWTSEWLYDADTDTYFCANCRHTICASNYFGNKLPPYCEMCGKAMTGEAWGELEKRIGGAK